MRHADQILPGLLRDWRVISCVSRDGTACNEVTAQTPSQPARSGHRALSEPSGGPYVCGERFAQWCWPWRRPNAVQAELGSGGDFAMTSLTSWGRRLLWALSYKDYSGGIPIGVFLPLAEQKERDIPKIVAALNLIRDVEPRRYQRMVRDVGSIQLLGIRQFAIGSWNAASHTVDLATDWVENTDTTPEAIAATLVHEATHARFSRFGYPEPLRGRLERICFNQERMFAERLPSGQSLAAMARRAMDTDSATYSPRGLKERRLAALRSLGLPRWFLKVLERVMPPRVA